jgi:ligand-binding sensor domain-containing protein
VEVLLKGVHVKHVVVDARGVLWAATMERGLASRGPGARDWTFRGKSEGMPEDTLTRVALHRDRVWVAFATGGVARLEGTRLVRFTTADGTLPGDEVAELVVFRDRLWALTDRGLATWSGSAERFDPVPSERNAREPRERSERPPGSPRPDAAPAPSPPSAGFEGQPTALTVGGDGRVWIGTDSAEVCSFDGSAWACHAFSGRIAGRIIKCVCPSGRYLWFGTLGSLNVYTPATGRLDDETAEKPALFTSRVIRCIAVAGDSLLIGVESGGLYRLHQGHLGWRLYSDANGLPSPTVNAMTVTSDSVLVATSGGVARIDLSRSVPGWPPAAATPSPSPATPAPSLSPAQR